MKEGQAASWFTAFAVLVFATISPGVAQQNSPIRNLGASLAVIGENWLVSSVFESFRGEDLNGDGDTGDEVVQVENLSTGESRNLGLAVRQLKVFGDWLMLQVAESSRSEDLNGDGDTEDTVVHVHQLSTGMTTNVGLVGDLPVSPVYRNWLVIVVSESDGREDLNGDGDTEDNVPQVHNLSTGENTNLRLASRFLRLTGEWLHMGIKEDQQGEDLNGDGDREDEVAHVDNLSTGEITNLRLAAGGGSIVGDWLLLQVFEAQQGTDLNGDGDQSDGIHHLHNLSTGETRNLGAHSASMDENWLVYSVWETHRGEDLNDDGDTADAVLQVEDLSTGETRNVGLAGGVDRMVGDYVVFEVPESEILHVHQLSTGHTTNLGLHPVEFAAHRNWVVLGSWNSTLLYNLATGETTDLKYAWIPAGRCGGSYKFSGDWLVLGYGCGSPDYLHNLPTGEITDLTLLRKGGHCAVSCYLVSGDWLLFSSNDVAHIHQLSRGETTNLKLPRLNGVRFYEDCLVFSLPESEQGEDLNGDGDMEDSIYHLVDLSSIGPAEGPDGVFHDVKPVVGPEVNTPFGETEPTMSADGRELFFDSNRPGGQGGWDLYLATRDSASEPFGNVRNVEELNTPELDGTTAISADGLELYFVRGQDPGDINMYVAKRAALGEPFTEVTELDELNTEFQDWIGDISADGLELYFSSDRAGTPFEFDLYVATRPNRNAPFSDVIHLAEISTPSRDSDPSISTDGLTLFFDSARPGGNGGRFDIWMATRERKRDDAGSFVPFRNPVNLGRPVSDGACEWLPDISSDWPAANSTLFFTHATSCFDADHDIYQATWMASPSGHFLRGECNDDGEVNIADAACLLNWLFAGAEAPGCVAATNTNGDEATNIADATYLLNHLFSGGPAPVAPFPECGPGALPADQQLGCANPPVCQ